jgi:hypothetical protein
MYAEGCCVGKPEQCNKQFSRRIIASGAQTRDTRLRQFKEDEAAGRPDLYGYIIIVDEASGECYGRINPIRTEPE